MVLPGLRRKLDARDAEKIIDLYKTHGLTMKEIAGRFGTNFVKVREILRGAGIRILNGRDGVPKQTDKLRVR